MSGRGEGSGKEEDATKCVGGGVRERGVLQIKENKTMFLSKFV